MVWPKALAVAVSGLLLVNFKPANAAPQLSYPISEQLPPVARFGKDYYYQFAQDTFTSSDSQSLNYTISNGPSWLSLDSSSRSFSGAPPSNSSTDNDNLNQTVSFVLSATDSSGSAQETVNLLIVNSTAPEINSSDSLRSILEKSGSLSGSNDLVLIPGNNFTIKFPSDFFVSTDSSLPISYSAVSTDGHSPLPIWLDFDSSSVEFSGVAPIANSQIAPSQSFGVSLVAIEYQGYMGNQALFNLVLGAHQFTTNITENVIKATVNNQFEYSMPMSQIFLDDSQIQLANISSISLNDSSTSSWLSVDASNGTITGTPPSNLNDTTQYYQVTVEDSFQDTITYTLILEIGSNSTKTIFTSDSLNTVNATRGDYFQYDIKKYLVDSNANLTLSYSPKQSWLTYHASNFTFNGIVPSGFSNTKVSISGSVSDGETENTSFTILGQDSKAATATKTASSTSSSKTGASSTTTSASSGTQSGVSTKTIAILCGVLIPCCVILALVILFFICRKRRYSDTDSEKDSHIGKENISKPMPIITDEEKAGMSPLPYPSRSEGTPTTANTTPRTAVETPTNFNNDGSTPGDQKFDWDSPQKASELNFLKMDNDTSHDTGDETLGSDDHLSSTDGSFSGPQHPMNVPPADSNNDVSRPRNSWRQTDGSDKQQQWKDHQSLGSLATISTDELLTMRLVDRDSYETSKLGTSSRGSAVSRDTYMDPTRSMILDNSSRNSIVPPLPAEFRRDSPNIQPVGSHSSTLNLSGHSQDNSVSNTSEELTGRSGVQIPHDVEEEHHHQQRNVSGSANTNYTDESFGDHYRTASSGDDFDEMEPSDNEYDDIRPYRNSRGQLTWSKVTDSDASFESEDEPDLDTEYRRRSNRDSRRDTARIVDFTKGRNPNESQNSGTANLRDETSAELAFL